VAVLYWTRKAERLASPLMYTCKYNVMRLADPTVILSGLSGDWACALSCGEERPLTFWTGF
jgi:hypothetical protein